MMFEGGGSLNGSSLHLGLMDDVSALIYTVIDGLKGAATIFDCDARRGRVAANSMQNGREYRLFC